MLTGPRKWLLCVLLFLATTLNYLDRQTLSILAPIIQRDMGLDNADLGVLFSVFYYAYTLSQFAVGALLDRLNLRWAYGGAVLAWSAVASGTAMAAGFAGLLGFRLLLGVAESANWPAAMRIVARALPPQERALGNGIFTSGTSVGALVAPLLILAIARSFGWRMAFVAVGALGALWFALWAAFTAAGVLRPLWRDSPESVLHAGRHGYREILSEPRFWKVFAVTILVNPCLYFNLNWLPTYFVQQRGVPAGGEQLGWILTAIYLGLDAGYLAAGTAAIWLARVGWSVGASRRIVFLAATGLLGLAAAVPLVASLNAALAVLTAVNFGAGAWIAVYLTMAQEVSATRIATAAGLLGGSGSLAGALAMWAVGKVTQATGSFLIPMIAVTVAAILAAAAGLAATRPPPVLAGAPGDNDE